MNARLTQQFAYISSQTGDQPLSSHHSRFMCRYGYGRSAESASMGESGQDFAAVRIHKSVCCFVLCDGVGLSYRGDFAAAIWVLLYWIGWNGDKICLLIN